MTNLPRPLAACLAAALTLSSAGCSVNPATGRQSFTAFMSPAEEIRIGRELHPKVLEEFGGTYHDAAVNAYVNHVGQTLAGHSELAHLNFTFTVLNSDVVNAFAVPGGYVYVTRALVALAGNEAELAGVLAHEIGHVTARHTAERYSQAMLAGLLAGIGGAAVGHAGLANVLESGAAVYLQGFSRDQEYESDLLGVRYLMRAGYENRAMASFLGKLQAHSRLEARLSGRPEAADAFNIMSTHPRTADRVERAMQAALARGRPAARPRLGAETFLNQIDGMFVGGDPRNGIIKGRRFIHPRLRFRFEVPEGFRLINGQDKVGAIGPKGARIIFDLARPRGRVRAADYMVRTWAPRARLQSVERITVNGLDAATGTTRVQTKKRAYDVRLVAIAATSGTVYRFLLATPPALTKRLSVGLRRTTFSFRLLTPRQAKRARPFRLRVITAKAGDTVETLAARLPYERHRVERFRVLNGLQPGEEIRGQRWVKIVTR